MSERKPAKESTQIELEQFLPYVFYLITSRLSQRFLERLRPHGMTVPRWRVLMVIANKGPSSIGRLVELTFIPQSGVSRVIDQMERDKLVVRRNSAQDQRVVEVHLTARGKDTYRQLAHVAASYADAVVSDFTRRERAELFTMLCRVLSNLHGKSKSKMQDRWKNSNGLARSMPKARAL